jgi:hypothetical protein
MIRESIIPLPPPPETIDEKAQEYLEKWILYFETLSSRIKVVTNKDPKFNLDFFLSKVKDWINEGEVEIEDWPTEEQIAFIISIDSSLPNEKPKHLIENTYFFCYGNKAFGLHHFERDSFNEKSMNSVFSLFEYSKDMLEWKFILSLIKNTLRKFKDYVPAPP